MITRIESDDGPEPQLRGCLRGRSHRQRVYHPDRLLHPMKRVGERGEGRFEQATWDEALDTVARELERASDIHGPASILFLGMTGDVAQLNHPALTNRLLAKAGGIHGDMGHTVLRRRHERRAGLLRKLLC